jgi:hypothetical protein
MFDKAERTGSVESPALHLHTVSESPESLSYTYEMINNLQIDRQSRILSMNGRRLTSGSLPRCSCAAELHRLQSRSYLADLFTTATAMVSVSPVHLGYRDS